MTSPFVSPVSNVLPSAENATDTGKLPSYSLVKSSFHIVPTFAASGFASTLGCGGSTFFSSGSLGPPASISPPAVSVSASSPTTSQTFNTPNLSERMTPSARVFAVTEPQTCPLENATACFAVSSTNGAGTDAGACVAIIVDKAPTPSVMPRRFNRVANSSRAFAKRFVIVPFAKPNDAAVCECDCPLRSHSTSTSRSGGDRRASSSSMIAQKS